LQVFRGYVLKALASDELVLETFEGAAAAEARFTALLARCNDPATNTIILRQVGMAPAKLRGGRYGNKISFRSYPCPASRSLSTITRLDAEGQRAYAAFGQLGESVDYQAVTRGGRAMDHVLRGKVLYRDTLRVTSSVAAGAAGAAVAAAAVAGVVGSVVTTTVTTVTYTTTASGTTVATTTTTTSTTLSGSAALSAAAPFLGGAVALMIIWKASKMIADAIHPEGDIRGWNELPSRLHITCASLEPGHYELRSDMFDPLARPLPEESEVVRFHVEPGRPALVLAGSPWN
ncbi:MAG: hypothetical protein GY851_02220, partial [bacterium]|nr:hypothetical protein [bacterium]